MKKYIYILLLLLTTAACSRFSEEVARKLIIVDMLAETYPDSALRVLREIETPLELGTEQYARYCLASVRVQDMLRHPLTTDSLIKVAVKFFERNPERFPPEAVEASYYLARVYQATGRNEEAMELYLSLEPRIEALKSYDLLGLMNGWMGQLFRDQNLVDQSIEHYRKATKYFELTNTPLKKGYALSALGYNYLYMKQYDSAAVCLQEARQIALQINDTLLLSESLATLGIAQDFLGNTPAVKLYLSEAIAYEKREMKLVQAYNYLAGAYFKESQYELARWYANRALELSENSPDAYSRIYNLCNSALHLYNIERAEGRLRAALDYFNKYSDAKDSIAVLENRSRVLAVQEKYKAEELKAENMRLMAERESGRFLQMLGIFLAAIFCAFSLIIKWLRQINILKQKEKVLMREARLKDFLLKRLDVSKELVTLAQYPASDSQKLQQKLKQLVESQSFKLSDQKELIVTVNELFNNFAETLMERYPQLTDDELQLCCMVRCGFEAGLMATSMGVNLDSIYKKRSRLRKKINLERDEDFEIFLQKLG